MEDLIAFILIVFRCILGVRVVVESKVTCLFVCRSLDGGQRHIRICWRGCVSPRDLGSILSDFFSLEVFRLYIHSVKVYLSNCLTKSLEINSFFWTSFLFWFPFYFICVTYSCKNFVSWYFHVLSFFFLAVEFLHLYGYCYYITFVFSHSCIAVGCYGLSCVPPIHVLKP